MKETTFQQIRLEQLDDGIEKKKDYSQHILCTKSDHSQCKS